MIKKQIESELSLEGQAHEVAEKFFKEIIDPMGSAMFGKDPEIAHTFMCHVLWMSMNSYAGLFKKNGTSEEGIKDITEQFLKALREHPNELMC
ncbi:hypothetical protein I2F27_11220 [Acinetobacter sp. B5B]|uniref:hypothetical protein n=1 Tax=Acinetobacter baretiae TaxID=2605383 RepID=UPI0018C2D08E|nr:hypothetical protein [Acinetobacter baretiae]MBF7683889.1 hypothetical protein [Acinetobacter baretiae]